MPLPDALAAAEKFRAELLRGERAAAVRLVNAYGAAYQRIQPSIDALTARIDELGEAVTVADVQSLAALKRLQRQIEDEVGRYAVIAENEISQQAKDVVALSQQHARAITQAALPGLEVVDVEIMARWNSLNPDAVNSLLGFLADDSPLMVGLRDKLGPAVADQVASKLFEGIALGYNPRKVAALIEKELGQGLTWSLRTARTAQLYAYREGTRAAYLANPDIVKGWTWRSARDDRTCLSCLAQDGSKHKSDETLNDHHNGRCAMLPDVVSYRDLGLNVPEPPPVVGDTGEAWFRAQTEATQRAMMGPGKHDAWKAGKFDFADLSTLADPDPVYGRMRVETTLHELLGEPAA